MNYLTVEEVFACHDAVLARYGGCPGCPDGSRVEALIGRVVNYVLYGNIQDPFALAVMYCVAIAQGCAFADGNKRIAACAMLAVLKRNGIHPTYRKEFEDVIVRVAEKTASLEELTSLLRQYCGA